MKNNLVLLLSIIGLVFGCHNRLFALFLLMQRKSTIVESFVRMHIYLKEHHKFPSSLEELPKREGYANQITDGWQRLIYKVEQDNFITLLKGRFIVQSPKTEHIEGKESRIVPLFTELLPYFQEAFELAPEGESRVITKYDANSQNLRSQAHRIIRRAGLTPWPKTFQNLRSSGETELVEDFPIHVVTEWIGNSPEIAKKHYLQITEDHYRKAAQNTAQQVAELARNDSKENIDHFIKSAVSHSNCETLQNVANSCNYNNLQRTPPRGLEPLSHG